MASIAGNSTACLNQGLQEEAKGAGSPWELAWAAWAVGQTQQGWCALLSPGRLVGVSRDILPLQAQSVYVCMCVCVWGGVCPLKLWQASALRSSPRNRPWLDCALEPLFRPGLSSKVCRVATVKQRTPVITEGHSFSSSSSFKRVSQFF